MLHLWRGQALEMLGRTDEALDTYRRGVELSGQGSIFLAALARGHAVRGERADAQQVLAHLASGRHVPAFEIAKVHVALGDHDEAFGWLDRAFEARAHSLIFLRVDPQLAALRGDPQFEQLARRMGFSPEPARR
jgi:tetratricopeptide (TPR) repeat protein